MMNLFMLSPSGFNIIPSILGPGEDFVVFLRGYFLSMRVRFFKLDSIVNNFYSSLTKVSKK